MATLLGDDIRKETGVTVLPGLLDKPGILDKGSPIIVDGLIPDYQILGNIGDVLQIISFSCLRCCFCAVAKKSPYRRSRRPASDKRICVKAGRNLSGSDKVHVATGFNQLS